MNSGESLVDALHRELREEVGIDDEVPVEGPVAIADSIAPVRSFAAKHVVHIIFAGDLGPALARGGHLAGRGRPRSSTLRRRRAGRGRAAPSDPALSPALDTRRTPPCYLGALWAR